jgi:hypothetical protein
VREIKFTDQLLKVLEFDNKKPARVYVVNIGCIFLDRNKTSGERAKHIDMKYRFIREQISDAFIEVKFIRTNENTADLFAKNLNGEKFKLHSKNIYDGYQ